MTFMPARLLILAAALLLAAPAARAQQGSKSKAPAKKTEKAPAPKTEKAAAPKAEPALPPPPVAEPKAAEPAPAPAAKKEEKKEDKGDADSGGDPLAKIFGEGGMDLKSEGINADFDPATGEMTTMHIWGGVDLKSELMNLVCEDISIDMVKQLLVAKGKTVKFKKEETEGVCGHLEYNIETKETLLTGPPKPIVRQKQPNGSVRETRAEKITMIQNDKRNNIVWNGNAEINITPAPEKEKPAGPAKKPEKIDSGNVGKIRNPTVGG